MTERLGAQLLSAWSSDSTILHSLLSILAYVTIPTMPPVPSPFSRWFLAITLAGVFIVGVALLILFSLPFPTVQPLANRLASDGILESFTPERFLSLGFLRWIGLLLILVAGAGWWARSPLAARLTRFFRWSQYHARQFPHDIRLFPGPLRPVPGEKGAWLVVGLLTLLSLANKAVLLTQPMGHDEAYTFIAFASRPFFYVIADYHLPNNHIFHTILVFLSTHLFGMAPWAVRLPAFLAGVLLTPMAYLAARQHYHQFAGLFAAGAAAVLPVLREYSTHARGYSLVFFFTLALLFLAGYVLRYKNRFAWLLFAVTSALGMYTIPTMLYSFAAVLAWLGISWLVGDASAVYRSRFWKYLFLATGAGVGLAVLLYLPVLWYSGLQSLTANSFVQALPWPDFLASLGARSSLALQNWQLGLPAWVGFLLTGAFLVGNLFHTRLSPYRLPLLAGLFLAMGVLLLWQRVAPEERVWLFALAFFILGAAAGLAGLITGLSNRLSWPPQAAPAVAILALTFLAFWSGWHTVSDFQRVQSGNTGADELAVLYLRDALSPGEGILTSYEDAPALWYYARLHGLPSTAFFDLETLDQGAWALVNTSLGQDLPQVISAAGVDTSLLDVSGASLVEQFGSLEAWQIPPRNLEVPGG